MSSIAVFPGSFDPITVGHEDIILRSIDLYDNIIVAIGTNSSKKNLYSAEERKAQIEQVFINYPKVSVQIYSGLTVTFCKSVGAKYILRGIRTAMDFEYERNIGLMNLELAPEIETIFLMSRPKYSALSSSVVREIKKYNGDISQFIPKAII